MTDGLWNGLWSTGFTDGLLVVTRCLCVCRVGVDPIPRAADQSVLLYHVMPCLRAVAISLPLFLSASLPFCVPTVLPMYVSASLPFWLSYLFACLPFCLSTFLRFFLRRV